MDTQTYMQHLLAVDPLRKTTIREAIQTLQLPSGSRGLDAGCGIGLQCLMLAEAVGLDGYVTGIDVTPEFLERGREIVKEAGLPAQISFQEGDVVKGLGIFFGNTKVEFRGEKHIPFSGYRDYVYFVMNLGIENIIDINSKIAAEMHIVAVAAEVLAVERLDDDITLFKFFEYL